MHEFSQEIEFMGSTVAHNMHEMQNILAIIHESAGLVEDILRINPDLQFQHRPKVEETLAHIRGQVQRGKTVLHATSKLGHSIDRPLRETCDLNVYAQIAAKLAGRMARMHDTEISSSFTEQALPISSGALAVLMQIYLGIEWAVGKQTQKQTIELCVQAGQKEHSVIIRGCTTPNQDALNSLQTVPTTKPVVEDNTLTLFFPASEDIAA